MKAELLQLVKKYDFVHFDSMGKLSIIVPVTGSAQISENFTGENDNPVALHLFGDNTCQSDIERKTFFHGPIDAEKGTRIGELSFEEQCKKLIDELQPLKERLRQEGKRNELAYLDLIEASLKEAKEKALTFSGANPGFENMERDLLLGQTHFVSKGEFVVKQNPDSARYFDLPNIMALINPTANSLEKILTSNVISERLANISLVKGDPVKTVVSQAVRLYTAPHNPPEITHNLSEISSSTQAFLQGVYSLILEKNTGIVPEEIDFAVLTENFNIGYPQEDYPADEWDLENVDLTTYALLKDFIKIAEQPVTNFLNLFQRCFEQYSKEHPGYETSKSRTSTYQLFILQTFLYLCTVQLHLQDKEQAKQFLTLIRTQENLSALVEDLCEGKTSAEIPELPLSASQWDSVIDATHKIALYHIHSDHYDELRTACMPQQPENSHYFVMGGRLCWSTSSITEAGNINTPQAQKKASEENFEIFYNNLETLRQQEAILSLIEDLLKISGAEEALIFEYLDQNWMDLTPDQRSGLFPKMVEKGFLQCAQYIIINTPLNLAHFKLALNQRPRPIEVINQFLNINDPYMDLIIIRQLQRALDAKDTELLDLLIQKLNKPELINLLHGNLLLKSIQIGHLGLVDFIVSHRPDLIEFRGVNAYPSLTFACIYGKTEIVNYLMDAGADIHAKTSLPTTHPSYVALNGRSARQWTEAKLNELHQSGTDILALFDNYYSRMEENFRSNPSYKDRFTIEHIKRAVDGRDLRLINLIRDNHPDLNASLDETIITSINELSEALERGRQEQLERERQAAELERLRLEQEERERQERLARERLIQLAQERQQQLEEERQLQQQHPIEQRVLNARAQRAEERRQAELREQQEREARIREEQERAREEQARIREEERRKALERQQQQMGLRRQILVHMATFDRALKDFTSEIRKNMERTSKDIDYSRCTMKLVRELRDAKDEFLNPQNEINITSFEQFKLKCNKAIKDSKPLLAEHRGWHNHSLFWRRIAGVFATLFVIPALIVKAKSENGYYGTFFAHKEDIKTNSLKMLEKLKDQLPMDELKQPIPKIRY
ncbi:Dot/Icm T4SS effector AnkF/LegA14/Ceg31 [Legionella quinlivanii]|uniref:Dot/Icm T4SS effector AnkF/LegA14/Ceg31 n=1 Tax=Legionella quinlivanii TaxID=45073 RepID=UPI002243658D|nr:Dot/Icm T4SS effector AnkF/LegA14/Ceg31 [Legionella quinlivanii]MCW8451548.1 ankyrin repeat domain-containing protein [Legionella quinlivanii]